MSNFCPPEKGFIEKYEKEAPHCKPVKRPARVSRYEKDADGNYIYDAGTADNTATIICAGDMLCEEKIYKAHYDGTRYYFHDVFSFIRPEFKKADLVIGNLETTICESYPYTGEQYKVDGKYHCNAPVEFLDAICEAGFDLLTLANNHCVDTGFVGAMETLYRIDERGMMRTGLFRPEGDRRFCLAKINGIPIAVLSYSTWFNRNQDRLTERGQAEIINIYEPEKVKRDVQAAKEAGAEFVLVYIHWGIDAEYKSQKSTSMVKTAQELADAGVDYIVGSHTHSVQEYDRLISSDGRVVPCMYSVGNFVTSEMNRISRETLILRIKLKKTEQGVKIAGEEIVPCYVPDSAYGIAYPIVPETARLEAGQTAEYQSAFSRIKTAAGCKYLDEQPFLTTANIANILGVKQPDFNLVYTAINFAEDAKEGGVAVIRGYASDPAYVTPEKNLQKLVEMAIKKGAKLLIASFPIEGYPCLVVDDVLESYVKIVREYCRQFPAKTVSITGSIGKTTTNQMIYTVLKSKYNTLYTSRNANSVRSTGRMAMMLKKEHEFYVQETMEDPFNVPSVISKMISPDIAVITLVGSSHMEHFGSQERILESCLNVQDGMDENGVLILNADDPLQKNAEVHRPKFYYGIDDKTADFRAEDIHIEGTQTVFNVIHDGKTTRVRINAIGKHNALDALAAFAVGRIAGMTDEEIVKGLSEFKTSGVRQNLVKYGGKTLFMDCYNASLEAIESSLEAFMMIPAGSRGRHIAVLGDVLELGDSTNDIHEKIGYVAAKSGVDEFICYGSASRVTAEVLQKKRRPVRHTDSMDELVEMLKSAITEADVAMFKASNGMMLDLAVDKAWGTWFREEYEKDEGKSYLKSDPNIKYRVYTDHATVGTKLSRIEDVVIPAFFEGKPVTSIGISAFSRTQYTKTVKFPDTLRNIRYCAFYMAKQIAEINLPASVRIVDNSAFSTCENLERVTIADGCTHLGYRAFGNCKKLRSITIPASVRQIGNEAFINCSQLTIYGEEGSYAEQYAAAHNIRFSTSLPESVTTHNG